VKARDPRKGYAMKREEAVRVNVKQNLSHVKLPLC
jgi:hypothetical protein